MFCSTRKIIFARCKILLTNKDKIDYLYMEGVEVYDGN